MKKVLSLLAAAILAAACFPDMKEFTVPTDGAARGGVDNAARTVSAETRHVMLYYVAGYNDLRSYLAEDTQDLLGGEWLPEGRRSDNVLLVFSKIAVSGNDFTTPVQPVLYRVTAGEEGKAVCDTLQRWDSTLDAADPATMREVLSYVKEHFPAAGYGMVFTSHATGWIPKGYYSNPVGSASARNFAAPAATGRTAMPKQPVPGEPAVKSLGRDLGAGYAIRSEIELQTLSDAIPYKLDYLLVDACLMGGIETAYALRGKCALFGASQTEVLADGFNYHTLTRSLLERKADPKAVCEEYFRQYDKQSGSSRSATISLIDCDRLDPLVAVCSSLFDKYRTAIAALDPDTVQPFGRYHDFRPHPWFFDLQDMLIQAGIQAEEQKQLQEALNACVVYKAATPWFFEGLGSGFRIRAHCGLSMYLPAAGNAYLNNWYKSNIAWNQATALVK